MGTRLVVSGQKADGKSVFVSDEIVEPVGVGTETTPLWASDKVPTFPISGVREYPPELFPTAGGYRFLIMSIPPDDQAPAEYTPMSPADLKRLGGGMEKWMEKDDPGMHTTDTVDFEVVLSGEVSIELDDGAVKHLKAGDCFVQNGTRHKWFNRGKVPALVAAILIGGNPRR